MNRVLTSLVMGLVLATGVLLGPAWGAELKVIQTQKTKDVVITLLSESGQWTQGKNSFVLTFTSAKTEDPVDVGKVSLNTSMPMPGMSPMIAGATLAPDNAPGRYQGTQLSRQRRPAGDGDLGRAGREGLHAVFCARALGGCP